MLWKRHPGSKLRVQQYYFEESLAYCVMWNVFDVLYGWFAIGCQRAELVSCCRIAFLQFPSRDIVLPQIIICTTAPAKPVSCTLAMYICVSEIEIKLAIELSPVLHQLIKSPRVTRGTYCFWSVSPPPSSPPPLPPPPLFCQHFSTFRENPWG